MQVNELNPWRTLIALSVFIVILIAGFVTMHRPLLTFEQDMAQSLKELNRVDDFFYPWQLDSFLKNEKSNVVLFDIRDKFIYGQGNIPGSENISAHDLTLAENIKRLENLNKQGITVVLYGDDQLQANGPWMVFRQVGFNNVKVLVGGYQYYIRHKENLPESKTDSILIQEIPRYNFEKIASQKGGQEGNIQSTGKKPVVVRRREKTTAGGGC